VILADLGPFDEVLDVGGNVGTFAEECRTLWPDARITSFEPLPQLATGNEVRSRGRWLVEPIALSDTDGSAVIRYCRNQHSASTMQEPGTLRQERFGIVDEFEQVPVTTCRLDSYLAGLHSFGERVLLKVDVEGHERQVLEGAAMALAAIDTAVVEVQNSPAIFLDSPPPDVIDSMLRDAGLYFSGLLGALAEPRGEVVQFDGVWRR
jgi:FkbM family methyltransferase